VDEVTRTGAGHQSFPSTSLAPAEGAEGSGTGPRVAPWCGQPRKHWRAAKIPPGARHEGGPHRRPRRPSEGAVPDAGPRASGQKFLNRDRRIAGQARHLLGHRIGRARLLGQASPSTQELRDTLAHPLQDLAISSSVGAAADETPAPPQARTRIYAQRRGLRGEKRQQREEEHRSARTVQPLSA
jgi:hypothetical protein